MDIVLPPEVALERFLNEKHSRGERKYAHIIGRVAVENLPPNHLYRWLVDWMNQQLSDIGVNSTGGHPLPPLHFDLVRVLDDIVAAHVFEAEEFTFIVLTQPMVDEMLSLSRRLVEQNRSFMTLQIAPDARPEEIAQLLLLMQFCFITSHEYSHIARRHLDDHQPLSGEIGDSLSQTQEHDADGYGIYHDLEYFFKGGGRQLAVELLGTPSESSLENSILSCFLLSIMVQFCARWARKRQIESDIGEQHPPPPMRIEYSILFVEMWCREVGAMSTSWMTDGTVKEYFDAAARLFPPEMKTSWDQQISWLKGPQSEQYRTQIRPGIDRLRTGGG